MGGITGPCVAQCAKNKHGILQLLQWLVIWGRKETLLVQSNMFEGVQCKQALWMLRVIKTSTAKALTCKLQRYTV